MRKKLIVHPFAFAAFPILAFFYYNRNEVELEAMRMPLIIALVTTLVLWMVLYLLFRRSHQGGQKTALVVSLLVIIFFSYQHVYGSVDYLVEQILGNDWLRSFPIAVALSFSLLVLSLAVRVLCTNADLSHLTTIANKMAMFLVIMNMGSILYFEYFIDGNYTMNAYSNIQHDESIKDTPDIYYLIFDRYPHSDILRKNYDYDNRYFDRYLEHKGFYNVKKATANYPRTELSLASSLGMTYLDFLTPIVGEKSSSMGPINKLRDGSKVAVFLKGKGYRFIHLGHLYGKLDKNSVVDVRINNYRKKNRIEGETKTTLESFGMKLFDETTLLGSVMTSMSINNKEYPSDKYHPKAVLKAQGMESTFEVLKQIPKQQDKKFVFAHFVVPHEPYVFNRDGTVVTRKQTKQRTKLAELKHQIGYTNKKIFEVVEAILAQSESDPIIIIQSDEGPYPDDVWNESTSVKKNNHTWHKADDKTLQEKLRIINFIYLPEEYENPFYATITPVNTFRVLFNVVFGSKLELLPDRNYVFHDAKHLYKFIDVTDRVAFID